MGTNFYIRDTSDDEEGPCWVHVGKRSFAGRFCYVCNATLAKGGKDGVHSGQGMHENCPICGRGQDTAGPLGVSGVMSWAWAIEPERLAAYPDKTSAKDEYGKRMTKKTLVYEIGSYCRIQYTDLIGKDFS